MITPVARYKGHFMKTLMALILTLALSSIVQAEKIELELLDRSDFDRYVNELLLQSLKAQGHEAVITPFSDKTNTRRVRKLVVAGRNKFTWAKSSVSFAGKETLVQISTPLQGEVTSEQVLLITPGSQHLFDDIKTLEDLQNSPRTAALGEGSPAVQYWKQNNLKYITVEGGRKVLIKMQLKGGRGFDYTTKGVYSALALQKKNPGLAIEENILLVFPEQYFLFFSKEYGDLIPIFEKALADAQASGLIKKLFDKHFSKNRNDESINVDKRTRIHLSI